MKRMWVVLALILFFPVLHAPCSYAENSMNEYAASDWKQNPDIEKVAIVIGFLLGSGYVANSSKSSLWHFMCDETKYGKSIDRLYSSISSRKIAPFNEDEAWCIYNSVDKTRNEGLNAYFIPGVTVGQIRHGIDKLYEDFKNQSILLADAVYVVKKQIQGSDNEEIERVLLFLRGGKQDSEKLIVKDKDGKIVKIISFP